MNYLNNREFNTPPPPDPDEVLRRRIRSAEVEAREFGDTERLYGVLGVARSTILHDVFEHARAELARQIELQHSGKFKFTALSAELPLLDAEVASAVIALGRLCRERNDTGHPTAFSIICEELAEAAEEALAGRRGPLLIELIQAFTCLAGLATRLRSDELAASVGGAR